MKPSLRPTFRIIGMTLMAIGITMVPSFVVSVICREWRMAIIFAVLAVFLLAEGEILRRTCAPKPEKKESIRIADGLLIVILCWITASVVGALPYYIGGVTDSPVDAFFESCSGFTTTGATALTGLNHLPRGILFWRSMTCWTGGIGILLFGIVLMPALGLNGQMLTTIDNRGPSLEVNTSKVISSVRTITLIYLSFTLIETILLVAGGMTVFNGLIHSMSTVSTGGFSRYDDSIGHFDSTYIRTVVMCFMILSGISFQMYLRSFREGPRTLLGNSELKLYFLLLVAGSIVITLFLSVKDFYGSIGDTISISLFQAASALTTTGFTTTGYKLWPVFCQMMLLILMFTGACTSSPGGGIKVGRLAVVLKLVKHGISMRLHPNFIESVRFNKSSLPGDKVSAAATIPFMYFIALFCGAFLLTFLGNPMPESFSASLSCLCNTGAGFGGSGTGSIYSMFNGASKLVLTALMIGGRLELYAIMVLFIPKYWTKDY